MVVWARGENCIVLTFNTLPLATWVKQDQEFIPIDGINIHYLKNRNCYYRNIWFSGKCKI